jgi:hypothetical protein
MMAALSICNTEEFTSEQKDVLAGILIKENVIWKGGRKSLCYQAKHKFC